MEKTFFKFLWLFCTSHCLKKIIFDVVVYKSSNCHYNIANYDSNGKGTDMWYVAATKNSVKHINIEKYNSRKNCTLIPPG